MKIPSNKNVHTAFYNVAAVASIVAVIFRNQTYVIGSTVTALILHIVVLFIDDDLV